MAKQNVDYRNISDYVELETLINLHLDQLAYKSDLIILITHYILTKVLDYECVELLKSDEKESYNNLKELPSSWNQLPTSYNLTYKNGNIVQIVSGMKKNGSFVLSIKRIKENSDHDQISSSTNLKDYIPDEFFDANHKHYKDLQSIINVSDFMSILIATILKQDMVKENESFDFLPPSCYNTEDVDQIGQFSLHNRDAPSNVNRTIDYYDYGSPEFYLQEDIEGEPTLSIYS